MFGGEDFPDLAVTPLYRTDDEWAVAIASGPVDGILHVGWTTDERRYHGQLAILVKPGGLVGRGYLAMIAPARRLVVCPRLGRELERRWCAPSASGPPPDSSRRV